MNSLVVNIAGAAITIVVFVLNPLLGVAAFCFFGIVAIRMANASRR